MVYHTPRTRRAFGRPPRRASVAGIAPDYHFSSPQEALAALLASKEGKPWLTPPPPMPFPLDAVEGEEIGPCDGDQGVEFEGFQCDDGWDPDPPPWLQEGQT